MATKVYEITATINLRYEFEVDARNQANAIEVAEKELENKMVMLSRDFYHTYDIDIEQALESEGH